MALISFVLWLPQARLIWKNRKNAEALQGVSRGTQLLVLVNATGWGLYAYLTEAFWVGAPGLINGPLAVYTLIILQRARSESLSSPSVS